MRGKKPISILFLIKNTFYIFILIILVLSHGEHRHTIQQKSEKTQVNCWPQGR